MNGRKNRFGGLGSPRGLLVRSMTLEQLESRRCFDAAMQQIGDTLYIRGGDGADTLAIADHGGGVLTVSLSSLVAGRPVNFRGVAHVRANTGLGDDRVSYLMENNDTGVPDIEVNLGPAGANSFNFRGQVPADMKTHRTDIPVHKLNVVGGANSDDVTIDIDQIASAWQISASLNGGDDRLSARLNRADVAAPTSSLFASGGEGNDRMSLNFTTPVGFARTSSDQVAVDTLMAKFDLGVGNDTFEARAASRTGPTELLSKLNLAVLGGAGNDRAGIDVQQFAGDSQIDVDAGDGDDITRLDFSQPINGLIGLLRGGNGNDQIDAVMHGSGGGGGAGRWLVAELGGDGDDHLGFAAVEQDFHFVPEKATAVLDGGNGFDTALAPPGAKLMNVEA